MIAVEIQYSLENLKLAMQRYALVSDKTEDEIVQKQSAKLGWNIYRGLKALAPAKGSIREAGLAGLKSGKGVHVRDSVMREIAAKYGATVQTSSGKTFLNVRKGKKVVAMATEIEGKGGSRMNLQALAVQRELNVRESARGFSGFSVPRPKSGPSLNFDVESRYGFTLSNYSVTLTAEKKFAMLKWIGSRSGDYNTAVPGLLTDKQQAAVNVAIQETTADTLAYVERKMAENARRFFN